MKFGELILGKISRNCSHQMSHFKVKMFEIRFWFRLRSRPRWGSLERSPSPPSWIYGEPTSKGRRRRMGGDLVLCWWGGRRGKKPATDCVLLVRGKFLRSVYYATVSFPSRSSYTVSMNRFRTGQRPCQQQLHTGDDRAVHWLMETAVKKALAKWKRRPRRANLLWSWPATDHEPHCRHVPVNNIRRRTESTPRSGWWRSHTAGIYSDCSTRWILNNNWHQLI